jgi:hypothetical protein
VRLPQWRSFGSSAAARSDAKLYYAFRFGLGANMNWRELLVPAMMHYLSCYHLN